ncbi:MAG TPA: hypothetical protein PLL69_11505 [Gemmatimonadales bacterium]|nr:hypothetical protein [Gemmatimonadales bacterium]
MSRRKLWGSLALVVAVMVGVSVLSTGAAPVRAGAMILAALQAARLPWWAAPAAGAALGLLLTVVVWRRRRVAPPEQQESGQRFDQVLDAAIAQAGDPRRHQISRLAGSGSSLGRISRETRLARDAVRTVIGNS